MPASLNKTLNTLSDGSWSVNDTLMLLSENYTILINYLNGLKNP